MTHGLSIPMVDANHGYRKGILFRVEPSITLNLLDANLSFKKNTDREFIPESKKECHLPFWHYSSPPSTCGFVNFNLASVLDYCDIVDPSFQLQNETLMTQVQKHSISVPTAMTEEEHSKLHGELPDSKSDHPHSMVFHPICGNVKDHSETVGLVAGGIAWDASLQNLLPESVEGIIGIIQNTCDQTHTHEINGHDAIFIGDGHNLPLFLCAAKQQANLCSVSGCTKHHNPKHKIKYWLYFPRL